MFSNPLNYILIVAFLALFQTKAGNTQFFVPQNRPATGSVSKASSTASERQLQLGRLGLTHGVANSQSVTLNQGGTTSIADSKSRTKALNLGGLQIGSTLTASKTKTNDAVSRGLSHDLNIGRLGVGSSLSRDNLRNGFGLQRSPNGGLKLGLGLLNVDLSRNPQKSQALTQAQAQAQGKGAFAKSDSNTNTVMRNFGRLAITKTESQSNALSGTKFGQSSAQAGGLTGRSRRSAQYKNLSGHGRSKRRAQFIPLAYPASLAYRSRHQNFDYQQANYGFYFPQKRNSNNDYFEQEAGANTQSNQGKNDKGFFENNGASSIASNLAADVAKGQLSSANVNQDSTLTSEASQNSNNAQSQSLNFDGNHQQAANANAGTQQLETEAGKRTEAHGGSRATNNDEHSSSSNIANTNSQIYEEGGIHGSQVDASSQSIFQDDNGQNLAAQTNVNVISLQRPDGSVTNSASSHASAVSHGGNGGHGSNAVASASASASSDFDGSHNSLSNAHSNAGNVADFYDFARAFGHLKGARGFANGQTLFRG